MRLSDSRLVSHRSPHSDAVADLANVETHQQRLVVTYEAMSRLFHSFGLIEPTQLTFDGSIVPAEFPGKQRDVAAWADAWGVDKAGVRVW